MIDNYYFFSGSEIWSRGGCVSERGTVPTGANDSCCEMAVRITNK